MRKAEDLGKVQYKAFVDNHTINITELFQFLASVTDSAVTPEGKIFVTTKEELCQAAH